jgi:predicted CopG family antitoxin
VKKIRAHIYEGVKNMKKEEKMKQINLKLTQKQLDQLDILGRELGNISKSDLIRLAISEFILKYPQLLKD